MESSNSIKAIFNHLKETPSQVNEHMEVLYEYARKCQHVTEFGAEMVQTTYAFLAAGAEVVSYDINRHPNMEHCQKLANEAHLRLRFIIGSVTAPGLHIAPTDMLFIDTLHTENQLTKELAMHARNVRKYIAFHDVSTFWERGEIPNERGLRYAIEPFMAKHPEWKEEYRTLKNNGLLILCRQ